MARGEPGEQEYTPQVSPEVLPRKIIPEVRLSPLVEGVNALAGALAGAVEKKNQADSSTWAGDQIANARLKAIGTLEDMKAKLPAGDPGEFTPQFLAAFDKQADDFITSAHGNPLATRMLHQHLSELRATLGMHAMEWEAQQRTAYQNDSIQQNLDKQLPLVRAHPEIADQVGSTLMQQINASRNDPATKLRFGRGMDTALTLNAALGLSDQDPHEVFRQLSSADTPSSPVLARLIDPKARAEVLDAARAGIVKGGATNIIETYRTGGQTAGVRALAALDSDSSIPPDLRDEVRHSVNSGVTQLREDARGQHAADIVRLEENVAKGQVTAADRASAWSLYRSNALDTTQLASTLAGLDRAEIKQAQDGVSLAAVADAYNKHTPIDPRDKDAQDAADTLFTGMARGTAPGSAGYANLAAEFAGRTGTVPSSAISWARANLTSGAPPVAAQAADLVARIQERSPSAASFAVDERTKAMADSISQAVRAGTDATLAVQQARQLASLGKDQLEELKQRWTLNGNAAEKSQPGALSSLLKADRSFHQGLMAGVPAIPLPLQAEFDATTRRYFDLTGGNLPQSRELAARDVKRTWGVTEVNGQRELMQYAPEAMFPGLTAAVVRNDLEKAVTDARSALSARVDPKSVRLIPTDRTARTGGLEWALGAPDEFGALDVVRGKDGNPLTYRLPVARTDFDAVRDRMAQAGLEKARQLQAQRREDARLQEMADADRLSMAPEYWMTH